MLLGAARQKDEIMAKLVIIPCRSRFVDEEHKNYGIRIEKILLEADIFTICDFSSTHLWQWKISYWEKLHGVGNTIVICYSARNIYNNNVELHYKDHNILFSLINDTDKLVMQLKTWLNENK